MLPTTDHVTAALEELAGNLAGDLIRPEDESYADARSVWNGMIDLRPAAVARCASTDDVRVAVAAAQSTGLALAVRGGGHNVAGFGTIDGGLVIDLSPMREVSVDGSTRRVRAGGGATLGDVDAATQAHGLVVPTGVVSETGIAGLTLSGGLGWVRRKWPPVVLVASSPQPAAYAPNNNITAGIADRARITERVELLSVDHRR
ncbi:MAG TPA: FAD-dependent oxidoreductase [Acidimicrobiia bacterium]|nr:FAD-dependent oxidoreductase [Acidimicrobiia bacterium]